MIHTPRTPLASTHRPSAALLWTALSLFILRVGAQALQRWWPQPFLPPFGDFQGSGLPYGVLLPAQLAIVAAMAHAARRVRSGRFSPSPRARRALAWAGAVYLAGSLGRIAVGLVWHEAAPAWFTAWIPAVFHTVLAAFVLCLALCREPGVSA